MNYLGVGVALLALVVYLGVRPEDMNEKRNQGKADKNQEGYESLQAGLLEAAADGEDAKVADEEHAADAFLPHLSRQQRFMLGAGIALLAGLLYGTSFDPSQRIIDHSGDYMDPVAASTDTMDYVFSHFNGILLTSVFYWTVYCVYKWAKGQAPEVYPQAVLPAFLSGAMWAVAMIAWFVANGALEFSVTFPIVTSLPGLVASVWGVLVFGEIKGVRNLVTLCSAFVLTITAGLLVAFSK
jgi:hypothetical protein